MYLRRNRRRKHGEQYEYWTLVESVRTAKGPRQRIVAHIGKEPGLDVDERYGWEHITRLLDGEEAQEAEQLELYEEDCEVKKPLWAEANLRGIRVERVRDFGKVYVSLALWRRLKLHEFFESNLPHKKEKVSWSEMAFVLSAGRFCEQVSELALAERWYAGTALEDILGIRAEAIYDNRLYRSLDKVLRYRQRLFTHLRKRYEDLFGSRFEFILYDITSTYFEGQCAGNEQAQRGYSRDHRGDCKQVCIGLVVSEQGLPLAYEVFDGNRADVTTIEEMVELMQRHYGVARRVWVLDRGMVSEENLDYLREQGARYIVGTPKSQLKQFEQQLLSKDQWSAVQEGLEVKLVDHPNGQAKECFVLCRSQSRHQKEAAMLATQRRRLKKKLVQIDAGLRKRAQRVDRVERRIGRWLGRYTMVEDLFSAEVLTNEEGKACALKITEDESKRQWSQSAHGAYLLRTNYVGADPPSLWRWYIQLTQAEDAFRCAKSDLGLRPIYHRREDRVQAHILICFLGLVLWRTLEMWLQGQGLGNCARQVLLEMDKIHSMDVVVPVKNQIEARLRLVAKPDKLGADLLRQMGLRLPSRPKIIQNVVEKNHQN